MKILVTSFAPFNNRSTNTSNEVMNLLTSEVDKITLPVSYEKAPMIIEQAINDYHPDFILALGEANRTRTVEIEKYAHNIKSASIPDNDGESYYNDMIDEAFPICLTPKYDVLEMVAELKRKKHPVSVSFSAGGYICNLVMYTVLMNVEKSRIIDGEFIHVPHCDDHDIMPFVMAIDDFISKINQLYNKK